MAEILAALGMTVEGKWRSIGVAATGMRMKIRGKEEK
jgi:hypothetical protein